MPPIKLLNLRFPAAELQALLLLQQLLQSFEPGLLADLLSLQRLAHYRDQRHLDG